MILEMNGKCKHCGNSIKQTIYPVTNELIDLPCMCKGAKEERGDDKLDQQAIDEVILNYLRNKSGMGFRELESTFENFIETKENKKAKKIAMEYAKEFNENTEKGLVFYGSYGTGKTHLASAIANELINKRIPVLNMKMLDMIKYIKDSFDESFSPLDDFREAKVLIIDDLGKESQRYWASSQVYSIIDYRYSHRLPTIITTNLHSDKFKEIYGGAMVDRLKEMTTPIVLGGESWRKGK